MRLRTMKLAFNAPRMLALALCVQFFTAGATAQQVQGDFAPKSLRPNPPRVILPDNARMQSTLYEAEQFARGRIPFEFIAPLQQDQDLSTLFPVQFLLVQNELSNRGIIVADSGRVNVEIVGPQGAEAIDEDLVLAFGSELSGVWRNRRDIWVPLDQLTALAQQLPEGYFMQRVGPLNHDHHSQGPAVTNSASYISGGADGSGITIALIDTGYSTLAASQAAGHAPSGSQVSMYLCNVFGCSANSSAGSGTHGTGCLESIYAHAPGANYLLYRTSSLATVGMAVDHAISSGANIISHSISWYNQGWDDDSGSACAFANAAADAGVLFFTSAGNRALTHWQGMMNPNVDGWHQFDGTDQTIAITFPNGSRGEFYLQWDRTGDNYDYDLYLFDSSLNNVFASSTNNGTAYESFVWINNTGSTQTVHLAVNQVAGGNTEFELFMHGSTLAGNFQHYVSEGSITSPSNSTRDNVISNAAVVWQNHNAPSGANGIIASYSSHGPSNGGAIRPDITGPTGTSVHCCGGTFSGTSAATPHNAGTAAALWSAHPDYEASAIRWLLFEQARLLKDWGEPGKDNIYGYGGSMLVDHEPNTVWLGRGYENIAEAPTGPYYTLQEAFNNVADTGRVLILPGVAYPEMFLSPTKNVRLRSVGSLSRMGAP